MAGYKEINKLSEQFVTRSPEKKFSKEKEIQCRINGISSTSCIASLACCVLRAACSRARGVLGGSKVKAKREDRPALRAESGRRGSRKVPTILACYENVLWARSAIYPCPQWTLDGTSAKSVYIAGYCNNKTHPTPNPTVF